MVIRTLSRQEFNWFGSARSALARLTGTPVEWFADDTGSVFGAIVRDRSAPDWSFVILVGDINGQFRALHFDTGLRNVEDARRLVPARMEAVLNSGLCSTSSING